MDALTGEHVDALTGEHVDALTPEQRAQAAANIVRFMSERDAREPEELGVVIDSLLPYQTRVIAELAELDAKREALRGWMRSEAFGAFAERLDQKMQLHYMNAYAACLMRRVVRFKGLMP